MTEEERNAMPILGGLHVIEVKQATMEVKETIGQGDLAQDADPLPF